ELRRHDRGLAKGARMTPAARLSAAIEVFAEVESRRRPSADVLKDWGLSHRFAGSSDRAAIAGLVYDALRRKASSCWSMGEGTPRAALLGMLRRERGLDVASIEELCSGATERSREKAPRRRLLRGSACAGGGRLSGLARSASGQGVRRRSRRRGSGARDARAARSAGQYIEGRARGDSAEVRASERRSGTMVAGRLAHSAWGRRQEPGDPRRAAVPQR